MLAVAAVLALVGAGCGSSTTDSTSHQQAALPENNQAHQQPSDGAAHDNQGDKPTSQTRFISAFHVSLVKPGTAMVRWDLTRPAALSLVVSGLRHGSTHGQTSGVFAIAPSDAAHQRPAAKGPGHAKVNFEFGESNFQGYKRLQFRLRAQSQGSRELSDPVIVTR